VKFPQALSNRLFKNGFPEKYGQPMHFSLLTPNTSILILKIRLNIVIHNKLVHVTEINLRALSGAKAVQASTISSVTYSKSD
jgi:hypothetical protein